MSSDAKNAYTLGAAFCGNCDWLCDLVEPERALCRQENDEIHHLLQRGELSTAAVSGTATGVGADRALHPSSWR